MSIRVVASAIERDDRLLVCGRPTHQRHGGVWESPGDKGSELADLGNPVDQSSWHGRPQVVNTIL